MADVLKKVITANDYKNGSAVALGGRSNIKTIDPVHNEIADIPNQTGILDTRFDDYRYYTGDSA